MPLGVDVALDCGPFHTDVPEIVNEMIVSVRKQGRTGLVAAYVCFTNHLNFGTLMGKRLRLNGNGQAPVHKWWKELDPTS